MTPPEPSDRILSALEVCTRLGISRTTIWRLIRRRQFPTALRLSPGRVGWPESQLAAWIASRSPKGPDR